MQTIEISNDLLNKLKELCREGGYENIGTWLEETVENQFTAVRRQRAEGIAKHIREGLYSRGHTEEEVLNDFKVFRERLRRDAGPA